HRIRCQSRTASPARLLRRQGWAREPHARAAPPDGEGPGSGGMSALEQIRSAFMRRGIETYGEGVSQLEHALQCAACAERDGAGPALIAATLLHDIGHLIHDLPVDIADQGIDAQHESLGSAFLSQYFG